MVHCHSGLSITPPGHAQDPMPIIDVEDLTHSAISSVKPFLLFALAFHHPGSLPLNIMLALLLVGALPLVAATTLQKRVVQVQATCGVDYPWSTNSKNESPCQVAAKLDAICNNGSM